MDTCKAAEIFWEWFLDNKAALAGRESGEDPILNELLAALKAYHPDLWFEVSMNDPISHELIITACGDEELFPIVRVLVENAPIVPEWEFFALKPAHGFRFVTRYEGIRLDPRQIRFIPLNHNSDPMLTGLRVFVPDYDPKRYTAFKNGLYTLLDTALGEFTTAMRIRIVDVLPMPSDTPVEELFRLEELAEYLETEDEAILG